MSDEASSPQEAQKTVGIVLAAGAGTRMGQPKALVRDDDGRSWLDRAITTVLDGGCEHAVVVLGAAALPARQLVPVRSDVTVVETKRWRTGMSASLAAGLSELERDQCVEAALVTLVDLPTLPAAAVTRILTVAGERRTALRQAGYRGLPGHPVLLGRSHWAPLREWLQGDRGAGRYLRANATERIECGDLWDGRDRDLPERPLRA